MIFYVLNKDDVLVETIQSPDESGVAGITAIQGVVEEKLSTYELIELIVPADSDGLEDIEEEMAVVFKDISGWREYIIYEIEDIDGDSLETSIRAELSSSELIDEVIERDIRGISNNPTRNLEEILDNTRWLAGQVDSSLYSQPFNVDTNYMNVLEALNEYATRYGAEIRFRYEVDGNKVVRRYVDVYKQFGEYKGKIFEIDRDMTSVKRTVNTELIKTTIIPYSKELEKEYPEGEEPETKETYRIGIEDIEWKKSNGDPVDKPLGQNYLVDPLALEKWGKLNADGSRRHKKIPMEFDFDNAEAIISMAWVQLGRYTQPRVYYEVSAIDLYAMTGDEDLKHEQILLGDTGGVKDHYFSNPLEIQTRLVEVKRDLFDPRNNDYVFGDPRTIFSANASVEIAEEVAKDIEGVITRIENAQTSIDGKTKVFRGSEVPVNPEENNIWFRPHPSKQGHTQMMLFNGANWEIHVDSSDLEDAGRLTFGTIDGANINVINLIADNISGGQLKLENGIEITHKGTPILKVNNSGEVEMNVSKMTINAMNMEEELARIKELEDGKDAYELAVENGFEGTMEEWLESLKGKDGEDGPQGPQGIEGPKGADGQSQYTHIRYSANANGSSMTTTPVSTTKYIGIAVTNSATAPAYTGFTWSKYVGENGSQGPQGPQGISGPAGANGQPTYTWVKYAEDKNGGGMSDYPEGKRFIGLAFNKTTQTESTTPSHYQWSEMPQNIEVGGRNLVVYKEGFKTYSPYNLPVVVSGYSLESEINKPSGTLNIAMGSNSFTAIQKPNSKYVISGYFYLNDEPIPVDFFARGFNTSEHMNQKSIEIDENGYTVIVFETGSAPYSYLIHTELKATTGDILRIDELKVEKGNIATDWTEAPEDTQAKIDEKAGTDTVDEIQESLNDWETIVAKKDELGEIILAMNGIADEIKAEGEVSEEISKKVENILERVPLIEQNLKDRSVQWNFLNSYMTFSDDGMLIKDSSGSSGILINEKAIAFIDSNNEPVADITNDRMRINRGIFADSVRVGQHEEYDIGNGHTITTWVGDVK